MPESETGLEEAFHERLLEALSEVKLYTRAGLSQTLRRIQTDGGLKVAKQLCRRKEGDDVLARFVNQPGQFFRAAERAGRIDLSIEAIVLEPRWAPLFTQEELKAATERLARLPQIAAGFGEGGLDREGLRISAERSHSKPSHSGLLDSFVQIHCSEAGVFVQVTGRLHR
jgi:hypothetical protein